MDARAGDYLKEGQSEQGRWLMCLAPRPLAAARLFCFPYAGGGGGAFREWAEALAPAGRTFGAPTQSWQEVLGAPPLAGGMCARAARKSSSIG